MSNDINDIFDDPDAKIRRVLIIEDDPTMLAFMRLRLKSQGYVVLTAQNGREGFQRAQIEKIDFVITDLLMPEWDGYKAISAIGEIKPHIKILVLTALAEEPEVQDLTKRDNVIGILGKPVDFDDIQRAILEADGRIGA